jgi:uncharacterized membrane protein
LRKEIQGIMDLENLWMNSMRWCNKYCKCHQMPQRSLFLFGYQFPLCARCTGIAIGHIMAFLLSPFITIKYSISVLTLPLIIDGTIQYLTTYESTNLKRVVSGLLYGFAFTSLMIHSIKSIISSLKCVSTLE